MNPPAPVAFADNLSGLQWNMVKMHVPEALAVSGGGAKITVAELSTGVDYTHPDLAGTIDFTRSVSCASGAPVADPAAWDDFYGLGTHSAGTIAAAANGFGTVGVAPGVKIASVRVTNDGMFYPEAIICGFMWAADHGINVADNPYFADPFLFNCVNDPEQRAIWLAEQRSMRYALQKGVTIVATTAGTGLDLSKRIQTDDSSAVTNACRMIPAEIPGVITVGALTFDGRKPPSSEYGSGVIDLVAPNGDTDPQHPEVQILSTWPAGAVEWWTGLFGDQMVEQANTGAGLAYYAYAQGLAVGTAQVAGVAALIQSRFGPMPPGEVRARILRAADGIPCPAEPIRFDNPPPPSPPDSTLVQVCRGGQRQNNFFGNGLVNALKALTQ